MRSRLPSTIPPEGRLKLTGAFAGRWISVAGGPSHQLIDETYWLVHFGVGSLRANPSDWTSRQLTSQPSDIPIRFPPVALGW
jgi:hypothetical protein